MYADALNGAVSHYLESRRHHRLPAFGIEAISGQQYKQNGALTNRPSDFPNVDKSVSKCIVITQHE